jgi:hypothetical protein
LLSDDENRKREWDTPSGLSGGHADHGHVDYENNGVIGHHRDFSSIARVFAVVVSTPFVDLNPFSHVGVLSPVASLVSFRKVTLDITRAVASALAVVAHRLSVSVSCPPVTGG